jgi:hypothetical protein
MLHAKRSSASAVRENAAVVMIGKRLFGVVVALLLPAPAVGASGEGYLMGLSPDGSLAVVSRDGNLLAVPVRGGLEHVLGTDQRGSQPFGSTGAAPAADDGGHHLIVWTGWEAGMAEEQTTRPSVPGLPPEPFAKRDNEVFVRLVDEHGAPLGPARRVTRTGPDESAWHEANHPAIAYDAAARHYVLVWSAADVRDGRRGTLLSRALDRTGEPTGPVREVAVEGAYPLAVVADRPGPGVLLAASVGPQVRRLHVGRLRSDGRLRAPLRRLESGRDSDEGISLAVGAARRRALVLWADGHSGADDGWHVRPLTMTAAPTGRTIDLPYGQGTGGVAMAARGRSGWRYAGIRETRDFTRIAWTQSAGPAGRPRADRVDVSPADERAYDVDLARGRVGWTHFPERSSRRFWRVR